MTLMRHLDGLNLYEYCHNNPVTYVDPSGNKATDNCPIAGEKAGADGDGKSGKNSPDLYHYTDENGAKAISETGTIRADDRGRVFVTTDEISPQDANNVLFMGTKGDDCATYRVEITLIDPNDYRLSFEGATQPNELIYYGSIRNGKNAIIVIKENDF